MVGKATILLRRSKNLKNVPRDDGNGRPSELVKDTTRVHIEMRVWRTFAGEVIPVV